MEDCATLYVYHHNILSNWLYHDIIIITKKNKYNFKFTTNGAKIVNEQNIHDNKNNYHAMMMAPNYEDNLAYQAAYNLIFQGHIQPNGYTEPLLHAYRLEYKKQQQKQQKQEQQQKMASATAVTTVLAEKDSAPKMTTTTTTI